MYFLTKYLYDAKIGQYHYWLNLNNSALLELDKNVQKKIEAFKKNGDVSIFSAEELEILTELEFLVPKDFDDKIKYINGITYNVSKYNNHKDSLKIDFALTNKCNFCCPYCFEKEELNKCDKDISKHLTQTAADLLKYISVSLSRGVKNLEVVFYGGEPTLEKEFVLNFIKDVQTLCDASNAKFEYVFVTNGFLFDEDFINKLNPQTCKFIQITLDGEKEFHNSRRTNFNKINTFDTLIYNINNLVSKKFKTVIRLNVDKTNYQSIKSLLKSIDDLCKYNTDENYLSVDIARVFGSEFSFDLFEYERVREELVDIAVDKSLMLFRIGAKPLTTFCIAESLSNDLVVDCFGVLYRCWNNVFNNDYKIGTIKELLARDCDPYETSKQTIEFVEQYSLEKVNKGKCLDCIYCKYCQGLCPNIRRAIFNGEERNIYKNNECKTIIKKRLKQMIERGQIND